jgi:aspartate carbamoyltransferase catalytic subunit
MLLLDIPKYKVIMTNDLNQSRTFNSQMDMLLAGVINAPLIPPQSIIMKDINSLV